MPADFLEPSLGFLRRLVQVAEIELARAQEAATVPGRNSVETGIDVARAEWSLAHWRAELAAAEEKSE